MKKTKIIYLLAIWLSLVLPAFSEDNPFLDRDTELVYEDKDRRIITYMSLTAVFYSGDTSRAVIDGQIVKKGDIINNLEVTEIKSEKVYFKDYLGEEYTLEMSNILSAIEEEQQQKKSALAGPTR